MHDNHAIHTNIIDDKHFRDLLNLKMLITTEFERVKKNQMQCDMQLTHILSTMDRQELKFEYLQNQLKLHLAEMRLENAELKQKNKLIKQELDSLKIGQTAHSKRIVHQMIYGDSQMGKIYSSSANNDVVSVSGLWIHDAKSHLETLERHRI